MKSAISLLALAAGLSAAPYTHDVKKAEEFRHRDGLPNVFAKIQAGQTVRVAYVGGSITAANGWRVKTLAWLKKQYPKATFVEINAAISGTGSDYAACRLPGDVLQHKPDLVFVEFRVNGGGGFERPSIEGVVRQIWQDNPQTDVCFVYTIGTWMLKDLQAGKMVGFGEIMEAVANRYGIPSIDLGIEVAKQVTAGTLTYKANEPEAGKTLFSKDGVHPGGDGHGIYCDVIARSMLKMQDKAGPLTHELGAPMYENPWEVAALLPIGKAKLSAGWTPVNEAKDPVYTDDSRRTKAMLRGAVKCTQAGETITVRWNGTTVGISDIPHTGVMVVEAVVDGKKPILVERKQREARRKYSRFWYLPAQAPGEHEVRFTIRQLPEGLSFYAGQILVIGTPLPAK
ncbi:MAG: SGNH/GDSL hydrolase family protein [Victivallales bacterium]|jgi:lysophospholipase L1-like esterase|nr:SGNH/GDSL hydrolase family protein [Victivallales bacterium]